MSQKSSSVIISAIKNRRSIRSYSSQEIEPEKINAILHSALVSPSARHERKWQLVVITNPDLISQLGKMKPHSHHVEEAQAVIVVISQEWQYWVEDASIVAEHIWLEAENQGLGSCWTQVRDSSTYDEISLSSEEYVKKVLDLQADARVLCMMPIGYPAEKLPPNDSNKLMQEKIVWKK